MEHEPFLIGKEPNMVKRELYTVNEEEEDKPILQEALQSNLSIVPSQTNINVLPSQSNLMEVLPPQPSVSTALPQMDLGPQFVQIESDPEIIQIEQPDMKTETQTQIATEQVSHVVAQPSATKLLQPTTPMPIIRTQSSIFNHPKSPNVAMLQNSVPILHLGTKVVYSAPPKMIIRNVNESANKNKDAPKSDASLSTTSIKDELIRNKLD